MAIYAIAYILFHKNIYAIMSVFIQKLKIVLFTIINYDI